MRNGGELSTSRGLELMMEVEREVGERDDVTGGTAFNGRGGMEEVIEGEMEVPVCGCVVLCCVCVCVCVYVCMCV